MRVLLVFLGEGLIFNIDKIIEILTNLSGVTEIRRNPGPETIVEVDYYDEIGTSIIRLNGEADTISFTWHSDSAVAAALAIQKQYGEPMRMIDMDYSFDIVLSESSTIDSIKEIMMK